MIWSQGAVGNRTLERGAEKSHVLPNAEVWLFPGLLSCKAPFLCRREIAKYQGQPRKESIPCPTSDNGGARVIGSEIQRRALKFLWFLPHRSTGQCLSENFYVRGDGTRVYFFTQGMKTLISIDASTPQNARLAVPQVFRSKAIWPLLPSAAFACPSPPLTPSPPKPFTLLHTGSACVSLQSSTLLVCSAVPPCHSVQNGKLSILQDSSAAVWPSKWYCTLGAPDSGWTHRSGERPGTAFLCCCSAVCSLPRGALWQLHSWALCRVTCFFEPLVKVMERLPLEKWLRYTYR